MMVKNNFFVRAAWELWILYLFYLTFLFVAIIYFIIARSAVAVFIGAILAVPVAVLAEEVITYVDERRKLQ